MHLLSGSKSSQTDTEERPSQNDDGVDTLSEGLAFDHVVSEWWLLSRAIESIG